MFSCLSFPACDWHFCAAYYIVICGLSCFSLFVHIVLQKETLFFGGWGILHFKSVLIFFTNFSWNVYYSKRIQRDIVNVHKSSSKVLVILVGFLWRFNFLNAVSEKSSNIKFLKYPSVGSRNFLSGQTDGRTDGRTERHDEANSYFSQIWERVWKNNFEPS